MVTSKDIYEAIGDFRKEVSKTLQEHGEDIAVIKEHLRSQNGRIAKNEKRLDDVEDTASNSRMKLYAYSIVVPTVIALLTVIGMAKATGLI